jgi:hypothetical protein
MTTTGQPGYGSDSEPTQALVAVLRGFTELTPAEQQLFLSFMDEYRRAGSYRQGEYKDSLERRMYVNSGPVRRDCPCCGR